MQEITNIDNLRSELIAKIKTLIPAAGLKETIDYLGFSERQNFVEVHKTKRWVKIVITSRALTADQKSWCRIVPESHKWTLDAEFKFTNQEDVNKALELISASYNYYI